MDSTFQLALIAAILPLNNDRVTVLRAHEQNKRLRDSSTYNAERSNVELEIQARLEVAQQLLAEASRSQYHIQTKRRPMTFLDAFQYASWAMIVTICILVYLNIKGYL